MGIIKKESINNTILSYIGAGLGFLSLIYIQPYFLGSENIGLVKLITSLSWVVALIMQLGMGNIAMRFFPKFRNDENKHNGFFGLLFLIVSIGAILFLGLFFLLRGEFDKFYATSPSFLPYYYYCFTLSYIISLISVFSIYSSGLMKTSFSVFLTDVFNRVGFIIVVFLFYFEVIDIHGLIVCYLIVHFIQLIILIGYLIKLKEISMKVNWQFFKSLDKKYFIVFAIVMMVGSFASIGIKMIDSLMLGHFIENINTIGVFAVCAFIPAIMEIPFNSLDRIAQPKIAYAWHHNDLEEINKIYEMSSRYLFFIGAVLFCFLYAATDFIFMTLPPEYESGKIVFIILSVSSLFNLLTGVNTTIITLSEKYFVTSTLLILLIIVAIILYSFLIPAYGIKGAAIATFFSLTLFNVLKYLYIFLRFKMQPFSKHSLIIAFSTSVCFIGIFSLPNELNPILKAITGGFITVLMFSLVNIRYNTIPEINKVLKKYRLLK